MIIDNQTVLGGFLNTAKELLTTVYDTASIPGIFKPGDIWTPPAKEEGTQASPNDKYAGNKYVAIFYSKDKPEGASELWGWNKVYDGSLAAITGAAIKIDADAGTIDIEANNTVNLKALGTINLVSNDVNITGNYSVNFGAQWINMTSLNGGINFISSTMVNGTKVDTGIITLSGNTGIKMAGKKIELLTGGSNSIAALELDPSNGIWIGTGKKITLFASSNSYPTYSNTAIYYAGEIVKNNSDNYYKCLKYHSNKSLSDSSYWESITKPTTSAGGVEISS